MNNVNGLGMHMRGLVKRVCAGRRSWAACSRSWPALGPRREHGRCQAQGAAPRVLLLWPHQIYDYDVGEDGSLTGIKFGTYQGCPARACSIPSRPRERITIWTGESWEFWDVLLGGDTGMGGQYQDRIIDHGEGPNSWARSRARSLCWKTPMADNRSSRACPRSARSRPWPGRSITV